MGRQAVNLADVDAGLANPSPLEIIGCALREFDNIAISSSGAEDVVLIDMACLIRKGVPVFSRDTGRLHLETCRFIDLARERYGTAFDPCAQRRCADDSALETAAPGGRGIPLVVAFGDAREYQRSGQISRLRVVLGKGETGDRQHP